MLLTRQKHPLLSPSRGSARLGPGNLLSVLNIAAAWRKLLLSM